MPTVSLAAQSRTEMLEELLESGRFDQLFFHMTPERFNRASVPAETAKSRSAIYKAIKDGKFPKPYANGERSVAWLASDIDAWIDAQTAKAGV